MNVLLVDDHNIVINGLKVLLKNEILNVNISEADTLESAYEFIEANQYEVAVLDLNLRGKFCFDLIKLIHSRQPQCKIMVYSSYSEEVYSLRVYKLGAKGYINKKEQGVNKKGLPVLTTLPYNFKQSYSSSSTIASARTITLLLSTSTTPPSTVTSYSSFLSL